MKKIWKIVLVLSWLCWATSVAAADFAFKDTSGKLQRLSDYKGKWVLVNFWATWCGPCIKEIPELVRLHQQHKDRDLYVISVAVDSGSDAVVMAFARKMKVNFPVINWNWKQNVQMDQLVNKTWGDIDAIPSSFLYNPEGKLAAQQLGAVVTQADIEAYLRKQVKAKK